MIQHPGKEVHPSDFGMFCDSSKNNLLDRANFKNKGSLCDLFFSKETQRVEKDVLIFVFIIRGVFVPIEEIKYNLKIEKYIHKTSQAIGLFIKIVDNVYKLENAFYEEENYEYKEQMEHIKKQYQEGLKNTFIQF